MRRRIAPPAMPMRPVPTSQRLAGSGVEVVPSQGAPASVLPLNELPFVPGVENVLELVLILIEQVATLNAWMWASSARAAKLPWNVELVVNVKVALSPTLSAPPPV